MHIDVLDAEFGQKVLQSEKPILVDFWAVWCGPCRMQDPILEELERDLGDKGMIARLNVDENPLTSQKFGIMSIPTLMLFNKGQVVKQWIGVQGKEVLFQEIKKYIN